MIGYYYYDYKFVQFLSKKDFIYNPIFYYYYYYTLKVFF